MPDFPIIDTHVHLWDPKNLRYSWLDNNELLNRRYGLEEFAQTCGPVQVGKIVFVECGCDPASNRKEAAWVTGLAEKDPRIQGIVANAPLEKGEAVREELHELSRLGLVRGIRRIVQSEPDPEFCLRPDFVKGVQLLSEFNLTCDICITHVQLAATVKLVRQCPKVRFILDHIGKPDIKKRLTEPWKKQLLELSKLPNVVCKVSGLATEADHKAWTREDLRPYIDHVIECFGFDRVMFGGDWPVALLATPYPRWVETLEWAVAGASKADVKKLFRDNAVAFYGLPR